MVIVIRERAKRARRRVARRAVTLERVDKARTVDRIVQERSSRSTQQAATTISTMVVTSSTTTSSRRTRWRHAWRSCRTSSPGRRRSTAARRRAPTCSTSSWKRRRRRRALWPTSTCRRSCSRRPSDSTSRTRPRSFCANCCSLRTCSTRSRLIEFSCCAFVMRTPRLKSICLAALRNSSAMFTRYNRFFYFRASI